MTIKIPLPWYSKSVYDAPNDRVCGGWRYFHVTVTTAYGRQIQLVDRWRDRQSRFQLTLTWGIGAWFV